MTAIAEELDRRLQQLDQERAARCAKLIRHVLDSFEDENAVPTASAKPYVTRTHNFGFKPGLDLTKLGQLAEEL